MLAEITGGLSLANTAYQFVGWVRGITGSKVIFASFRYDGTRIEGSDKIEVEVHPSQNDGVWFFGVKRVEAYAFVRFPLTPSGL